MANGFFDYFVKREESIRRVATEPDEFSPFIRNAMFDAIETDGRFVFSLKHKNYVFKFPPFFVEQITRTSYLVSRCLT